MKDIEFWFDFGSNYSYLSMLRLRKITAATGVEFRLKPFLLGPIFQSLGWSNSPFVLQEMKGRYVWRDMERECAKFGLGWQRPSAFPRNAILAARVALLGESEPWGLAFCEQVMRSNFAQDREVGDEAVIAHILAAVGADCASILSAAKEEACKSRLRNRTSEAHSRGIFGAPMFFVGDEMFWGNDRLDDAVAHALAAAAQLDTDAGSAS